MANMSRRWFDCAEERRKHSSQVAQHLLKSPAAKGGRMLTGKDMDWVPDTLALQARGPPATRRLPSEGQHSDLAALQAANGATIGGPLVCRS